MNFIAVVLVKFCKQATSVLKDTLNFFISSRVSYHFSLTLVEACFEKVWLISDFD